MKNRTAPRRLTKTDRKILQSYIPIVQGLAAYLGPSYEIVLHSLEDFDHSVIEIVNGEHTGRQVGAPITDLALDMLDELASGGKVSTVYFSRNKKGEPLKSSTIAIRNEDGNIIGLICINLYLNSSLFSFIQSLSPDIRAGTDLPANENFASDTAELIRTTLSQVRASVMADSSIMPSNKKKAIIEELERKGMFHLKDSVVLVADQLGISRNTVYMHLRNYRKKQE